MGRSRLSLGSVSEKLNKETPRQMFKAPQISRHEFDKALRGSEIRSRAINGYGIMMSPAEVAEIEKKIPKRLGGFIDRGKAKEAVREQYLKVKEMAKNEADRKEIKKERNRLKFLKDIMGLNRPAN